MLGSVLSALYTLSHQGTEILGNLPEAAKVLHGGVGIWTQAALLESISLAAMLNYTTEAGTFQELFES